jgi:hypothetical protein
MVCESKGWKECQPKIKLYGSRSLRVCLARGLEYPLPVVDNNKHPSKLYFYALYMISKLEKL